MRRAKSLMASPSRKHMPLRVVSPRKIAPFLRAFQMHPQPLWRLASALSAYFEVDSRLPAEVFSAGRSTRSVVGQSDLCLGRYCRIHVHRVGNGVWRCMRASWPARIVWFHVRVGCELGQSLGLAGVIGILLSTPWESGPSCVMRIMRMAC